MNKRGKHGFKLKDKIKKKKNTAKNKMVDCESEFRKEADLFLIRKFKAKASLDELIFI